MTDSEDSFDYEEDVSLESEEFGFFGDGQSAASRQSSPAADLDRLSLESRWTASANPLAQRHFRPLSVRWYIAEHFLQPARRLRRKFWPHLAEEHIVMILHHKKWSVGEATSDYFDDWPRLRAQVGLAADAPRAVLRRRSFVCPICCEAGETDVFALSCGTDYCASCYRSYVEACLPRGQLVRCMDPPCKLSLSYSDVELLLGAERRTADSAERRTADAAAEPPADADALWLDGLDLSGSFADCTDALARNALLVAAAKAAIDTSPQYRWCPAVDCQNLVQMEARAGDAEAGAGTSSDLAHVAVVACPAAHEFCFSCQHENHLPCPCWLAASWIKRCEDDSETVNWIEANTQTCPTCEAVIEKNGGCNHMVCGKCTHEFCWICLGAWAIHKSSYWQCNRYDAKEVEQLKKKQASKANSLNRYLHFYKRFCIHQVSMDGDKLTLQRVHRCMLQYMRAQSLTADRAGSWNDIQFLADAIRSLSSGRKTLMWTYAFAFHLQKTNFSEIFEGMQDYLTNTVEDLSMLFEEIQTSKAGITDTINARKADIVRLAASVSRRRELLVHCAQNGIEQGTLRFYSP